MALPVEASHLQGNNFDLTSLRGGLDDTSPYIALAPDACVTAENVEFVNSTLGERRRGCTAIELSSDMTAVTLDATTWMYRHLPVNDEGEAELWALTQSFDSILNVLTRRKVADWETIVPIDLIDSEDGRGHRLSAQTLHGKLFLGYKSQGAINRLHVFDGVSLRRCGLNEPAAPTAANEGAGSLTGTRYYRVRYTIQVAGTTTLRSEPSETLTFAPSGTGAAVRVTKPATINESETHWELEASTDNANFYRIATTVVGTTTYDDAVVFATGYAATGVLSADIGDYTTIPSGKYLSADQDRLIIAGSWEDGEEASRVRWTPVFNDPTGVGNDERLELDTDPHLDLDGFEGGEITGMSRAVNGYIFVFKRSHIYRLVRTGQRNLAYEAVPITKARGALPGSLVEAINQAGQPSLYFLDQAVGPTRLSANGLQWCGRDIQTLWQRVNINAVVPCHGVYYSNKRQLHYWLALDDSEYPNAKIVLHVNEMRDTDEGGRRGWVTVAKDDRIATAHCSAMFASNIDTTDDRSFSLVPLIGKQEWSVGLNTIRDYIQRCDTGGTDAHTTDDEDSAYRAVVITKPFALAGLLNQHEIKSGALLTKAASEPNGSVFVKLIQDFGLNEKIVDATLYTPTTNETHSIQQLDDLGLAEVTTLQIAMGDLDENVTPPDAWELHRLQLKVTGGITA
jgi:hypothetical protein